MRAVIITSLMLVAMSASAQDVRVLPPPSSTATIVLDHGAPNALVTALAFTPDGSELYTGGLDKVVRRYRIVNGQFTLIRTYPVPIGPGNAGVVNAIAVSPDGKWVAVGGRAPFREESTFGDTATVVVDTAGLSEDAKKDHGVVYLIDPTNPQGGRVVRGQRGEVRALTFAQPNPAEGPVLITSGLEWMARDRQVGAVHVINAATGKELAARADLPATSTPPGLAAWPTPQGLRVAIAWEDALGANSRPGDLLLWDAPNGPTQKLSDGYFNSILAVRTDRMGAVSEIISGGFQNYGIKGQPQFGQLNIRPVNTPASSKPIVLRGGPKQYLLPLSVAALGERTAVLVEVDPPPAGTTGRATELHLLTPNAANPLRVPLTGVSDRLLPVMHAAANGRFLAVGGFVDNRVEIFDGEGKRVQVLAGIAGGFTGVRFIAGNKLWVGGREESPQKGGQIFDFAARRASANPGNSQVEAPKGAIQFIKHDQEQARITVQVNGQNRTFALRKGDIPTAITMVPQASVVAVAHTNLDSLFTLITLFDMDSGRRVRQLVGPVQDITDLAVSANGLLIAGVANDRTVSVWSLKDLRSEQGALDGVIVTGQGNRVVVTTVESGSPADGKLAPGDIVEAVGGVKGELKAVATGHDFRNEVGARAVGSTVRVRRVRGKGPAEIVMLPVGRSLVQRDPLFILWIDTAPNPNNLNWIGWHPTGLYDANSPASEARIGWLTATGDPAQPAVVAGIGQFRKLFYKRTILERLVANAELVELPPAQDPQLALEVTPLETPDGQRLVRTPNASLRIAVNDPDGLLWLNRALIRWQAIAPDGVPGPWHEVALDGRSSVELPMSEHRWVRGPHRFRATFHATRESGPSLEDAVEVFYAPPAPELVIQVDGKEIPLDEERYSANKTVQMVVRLKPGTGTNDVAVELDTTSLTKPNRERFNLKGDQAAATFKFELDPSSKTYFKFKARNLGAEQFPDYEHLEVLNTRVLVRYVLRPSVRLRVTSLADGPRDGATPLYVVDSPEVSLEAQVEAQNPVKLLEWDLGDGKWIADKSEGKDLSSRRSVTLAADGKRRTIQVRATDANGQQTVEPLELIYAPLPTVSLPELPESVMSNDELALVGRAANVNPALPSQVRVLISSDDLGLSREIAVVIDPTSNTWRPVEPIQLFPGKNHIGLRISNDYASRRAPNLGQVYYRRPPLILEARPLNVGPAAAGDLMATVASPRGLAPRSILVNGSPVEARPPQRLASLMGIDLWQIRADAVPVRVGDAWLNQVQFAVHNNDGSRGSVIVPVHRVEAAPTPPPPTILVTRGVDRIQPGQVITTNQSRFAFQTRITSNTELVRATLWQQAGPQSPLDLVSGLDPRKMLAVADGFELNATPEIELREGFNRIRIVAANTGHGATLEFTVTYTPPPVRIEIEGIDQIGMAGAPPIPLGKPGTAQPVIADAAFVNVRGKVIWSAENSPLAHARDLSIVLTANQVVHFPAELLMPKKDEKERYFTAPLFLNAGQTRVRVEVRSRAQLTIPQQGIGPAEAEIICRAPLTQQRLHVVVIAPDVMSPGEEVKLVRDVLKAVGGESPAPGFRMGTFNHRAFSRAVMYTPLVTSVTSNDIKGRLVDVEKAIRQLMAQPEGKWVNDVVLIYYQGRDRIGKDGIRRLATSQTRPYPEGKGEHTMIRVDELERTPGLRLIVLNVANPGQVPVSPDALTADPLQLRYPWKDPAATGDLLPLFGNAVAQERTLGGVVERVGVGARANRNLAGDPSDTLPDEVRPRPLGAPNTPPPE